MLDHEGKNSNKVRESKQSKLINKIKLIKKNTSIFDSQMRQLGSIVTGAGEKIVELPLEVTLIIC